MSEDAADELARQRRFIDRFMTAVPHLAQLGVRYHDHGEGWAELRLPYADRLVGWPASGVLASGPVVTLMDTACGLAVQLAMPRWEPTATVDLRCDYLRAAAPGRAIVGRAQCTRLTRRLAFVAGSAHDGDPARPVALVAATFMRTDAA